MKKIFVVLPITLLLLISCNRQNTPAANNAASAEPETVYAVNTRQAVLGNLDDYLQFGGNVTAASTVTVMPTATGKIANIYVDVGSRVSANQIIMRVDPSQPGLTYEMSPVRAPIAGTITAVPYSIGATVAPSMPVAQIATTGRLEIEVNVAERFISRVKLGQRAELSFDAYPGETFAASVVEVSPVLDTTSRTMTVQLGVSNNPDNKIKIGMYARVKIITDEKKNIITVPAEALVSRSNENYVFIVSNDIAHLIKIKPGITVDDMMEVSDGLIAGDEVVTRGQTLLSEGSKVNIVNTASNSTNSNTDGGN
ncbi:MAG: efflux RND transporter periplasmic adaptor subunit [Spirochaetaceae bacterium]|nr:efflux RND transporter periplasmic adaptor subunit [Spirochaetaceae bacterium]